MDCKDYRTLNVYGQISLEGELAIPNNLDKSKPVENGFEPLSIWRNALKRYLKEIEF